MRKSNSLSALVFVVIAAVGLALAYFAHRAADEHGQHGDILRRNRRCLHRFLRDSVNLFRILQ